MPEVASLATAVTIGMLIPLRGVAAMIWQEWLASALWVIDLFVGINLLYRGFNWIAIGLALRPLPRPQPA
jgi:hypothetical protein